MHNTTLFTNIDVTIAATYKRIDKQINEKNIKDALRYVDLKHELSNGNGNDRANLIYYQTLRLINDTEYYDLDGLLQDIFGNYINFDSIKVLAIKNKEERSGCFLDVRFKNERYYIGPKGYRLLVEPWGPGLEAEVSSGSGEEGILSITSNEDITYDIIIIGSQQESSSSSGS